MRQIKNFGEFSYYDSGVKRFSRQCRLADGTKKHCAHLVVRSIPMILLRRKSCSALASTILESPLHRTKATCTIFFCAICQAALPGKPFDTRILLYIHIFIYSDAQKSVWQVAAATYSPLRPSAIKAEHKNMFCPFIIII